tara:strand:- start:763 stop:1377 length:615 start_codon:yes stop_codon:yes gene_type:complete
MKKIIPYSILFLLFSCATPGQVQQESIDRYNNQTIDTILECSSATGVGDPLESFVTINTQNCYKAEGGILRMVWNDQFIRAYVDKETKKVSSVQIYSVIYSQQGTWSFPSAATYLINGNLQYKDGTRIYSDVDCSSSDLYGSCRYQEHFGFTLGEEIFEEARRLQALGETDFTYRIKTQTGNVDRVFNVVEILGVEQKIKELNF